MDRNNFFDSYLTNHYSNCEKTNFKKKVEVLSLLNRNLPLLNHNFEKLFRGSVSKKSNILDLGCGYGSFLYFLKSHGYNNVYGVDISTEEIQLCKKMFGSYKLYCKDAFDFINNTNQKFEVIYLSHVLEHIEKDQLFDFLNGIRKILSKNGQLIMVVPNSAAYFNSAANRYGDYTHQTGFTDVSLKQVLMMTKYSKVTVKNYFGVGNILVNFFRIILLKMFEVFIQTIGYDKQAVYTPSILVYAKK
ncbi:MAG: hypothetical protein C0412_02905 [Flavobacterium sp.]|nr:hypothetical protein [Flavobacterium sp.]